MAAHDLPEVADALLEIYRIFEPYRRPVGVGYCTCCVTPEEMERLLNTPRNHLTAADLHSILDDAYTTWGDWDALCYFVPRLLELWAGGAKVDEDMLLYKLLWAARPEAVATSYNRHALTYSRQAMRNGERQAVFQLALAVASARMESPDPALPAWRAEPVVDFLFHFGGPVAPAIAAWRDGDSPLTRGRYALLLSSYVLDYREDYTRRPIPFIGDDQPVLPENEAVLHLMVRDAPEYLAAHAAEVEAFGPEALETVNKAFDWATYIQTRGTPNAAAVEPDVPDGHLCNPRRG